MRKLIALSAIAVMMVAASTAQAAARQYPPPPRKLAAVVHKLWKGRGEQTMICLAWRESRYNTLNVKYGGSWSDTHDHDWWQINFIHHRPGETELHFHLRLKSLWASALVALRLSKYGTDFSAWTGTYGRGECHGLN